VSNIRLTLYLVVELVLKRWLAAKCDAPRTHEFAALCGLDHRRDVSAEKGIHACSLIDPSLLGRTYEDRELRESSLGFEGLVHTESPLLGWNRNRSRVRLRRQRDREAMLPDCVLLPVRRRAKRHGRERRKGNNRRQEKCSHNGQDR